MHQPLPAGFWSRFTADALRGAALALLHVAIILAVYFVVRRIVFRLVDVAMERVFAKHTRVPRTEDHTKRLWTLQGLARSIAGYALFFILAVMLLDALGANVTGVLATAGVGGVAIGFGAQKLVRDIISGFFLIIEDQFTVGEYITIGGPAGAIAGEFAAGVVEDVGMRVTRLRDDRGKLWTISNGDITAVVNQSRAPIESVIEIGIAASADVEQARRVIDEAGEALHARKDLHLPAAPHTLGVSAFDGAHTVLSVSISAEPRAMAEAQRLTREAARERLVADGIGLA